MASHTRISLSTATNKEWLVDIKLNGTWEPAFINQDADQIQVTKIPNSTMTVVSCTPEEIEIAPTRFECGELSFEQVYKSVDSSKFTVASLVKFQTYLESLVSLQDQFGPQIEVYQFFNSELPLKLHSALEPKKWTEEGQLRAIIEIYSSASSLLAKAIPELPAAQINIEDAKLRWTWPGVVESIRLLLTYEQPNQFLPNQFLGLITTTDDPATLPASGSNKLQLFAFQTMHRAGVWDRLKEKISSLDPNSFSFSSIAELPVFKNLNKILQPEFSSAYYNQLLPAAFALNAEMRPYQEDAVLESLHSISELILHDNSLKPLSDSFSRFSSRFKWTKTSSKLIDLIYSKLSLASDKRIELEMLNSDGSLDHLLKSISSNERDSFIHLVSFANESAVLAPLLASVSGFPEKISAVLGHEFIFDLVEAKKWGLLQSLTAAGLRCSQLPAPASNQSVLLALALGRTIPTDLLPKYFDQPRLQNCLPFRMIATRYPESDQHLILGHIATRKSLIVLLTDDKVRSSEAYKNADVQTLLRIVLFRDRFQFLWLREKVDKIIRLPTGFIQHLVLEYFW